jgi:hypothetical protein
VPKGGSLDEAIVEEFAAGFRGELISSVDDSYDEARKVYNGMIDKRPALIVRPTGAADVIDAVNLAREWVATSRPLWRAQRIGQGCSRRWGIDRFIQSEGRAGRRRVAPGACQRR